MHQFVEHHPEFEGFSAYYNDVILPSLKHEEIDRLKAMKKLSWLMPLLSFLVIFGAFMAWYGEEPFLVVGVILLFGLAAVLSIGQHTLSKVKKNTKIRIVGAICRFLGWSYSESLHYKPWLGKHAELGIVPSHDRGKFEDRIYGRAHGAIFESFEAVLEKRRKNEKEEVWSTVFRGQILALEFDQKFLGETVVLRDKGRFNRKKKGNMKQVGLVDPVFEKIFEAYGTDQVEARYLLTPTFMQRLVDLENSVDGKKIRFAFAGGQLLIAVETKNRYEAGSIFKPLVETARTQKILDEIGAIHGVIDGVMKPAKR